MNFEVNNKLYFIMYYIMNILYIISDYLMEDITIEVTTLRILMYINVFIMNFGVKKVLNLSSLVLSQ